MKFISIIVMLVLTPLAVLAQDGTGLAGAIAGASSGSTSSSGASSGSQSQSQSALIQNNYASPEVKYNGSYTLKNVPAVAAPGIITAHNCALGASGGVAGAGFGITLGGSYVDDNCETISQAAALNQLAGSGVALTHLAQIPEVCNTLRKAGKLAAGSVCPGDKPQKEPRTTYQSASSAAPVVNQPYVKCEKRGGKIVFTRASGASSAAAKAACLKAMGY